MSDIDQTRFVIASSADGIWVDLNTHKEIDLDELFKINSILEIIYDSEAKEFYLLCNRRFDKIGFYLVKFALNDPKTFKFMTMV